jgi:hypothetical protein
MSEETSQKRGLKQKAVNEFQEFMGVFLYLAIFFCALAGYSMLLLHRFTSSSFSIGAALLNAFIVAKVILIGEYARLGKESEEKPLFYSAIYKAFMFCWLVFVFHIVEELIKLYFRGETISMALQEVRLDEFLARTLIVFCTFIPLFAFRELRRVLGVARFRGLFFSTGAPEK